MKDILVQDFDLEIGSDGDFITGESQNQSVEMLLLSQQGEWKEAPEAGCNITLAQHGSIDRFLDRRIRVQLQADGFEIKQLKITEKGLQLSGNYGRI